MKSVFSKIIFYSQYAPLLALIPGLIRFRYLSRTMKVLLLTPVAGMLTEIAIVILRDLGLPNLPLLHIYTIIQFLLIAWFYGLLFKRMLPRLLIPSIAIGFTIFSIINSLFIQPISTYNSIALGLQCLLGISFTIIGFYKIMAEMKELSLIKSPEFWANLGFLLYFSTNLFILILSNPMMSLGETANYIIWGVRAIFLYFFYLSLGVAFMVSK